VYRYSETTGALLSTEVPNGSGNLNLPIGIVIGPDGDFYVASYGNHKVARFSSSDGAYLGDFVSAAANGGLNGPNFMIFRPPSLPAIFPTLRAFVSTENVLLA